MIHCNGVHTIIKVALRRMSDKEIVVRTMALLNRILDVKTYRRANDLPAITAVTLSVLREQNAIGSVIVPTLMVLEKYTSEEAAHYLSESCSVLHMLLQSNLGVSEVCEHLCTIVKVICDESHVFRMQCIQCGLLESILEAVKYHSNHVALLYDVCDIIIILSDETALDTIACRFDVVNLLLHFLSSSFMSDLSFITLALQALHSIVCLSESMIDHFIKKQGLAYLCHIIEENDTCIEVMTACNEFLFSLASQYDITRDVIATGLIPVLLSTITVNEEKDPVLLLPAYQALRSLSCISIDCTRSLIGSHSIPVFVGTLKKTPVNEKVAMECVWILYQCSTTQEGCEELQQCDVEEVLHGLDPSIKPDHDIAIKRDMLLQNLQFARKQYSSSLHSTYAQPVVNDISHLVDSPLLQIMNTLVKCAEYPAIEVLISLKRLKTLCDNKINVGDLIQYGCDVTMMEVITTFLADTDIVKHAFQILDYFVLHAPKQISMTEEVLAMLLTCVQAPSVTSDIACVIAMVHFATMVTITTEQLAALTASPLLSQLIRVAMRFIPLLHTPDESPLQHEQGVVIATYRLSDIQGRDSTASNLDASTPVESTQRTSESSVPASAPSVPSVELAPSGPSVPSVPSVELAQPVETNCPTNRNDEEVQLFEMVVSFVFALVTRCDSVQCEGIRFFLANCALVSDSLLWLLKADIICRAITRPFLLLH